VEVATKVALSAYSSSRINSQTFDLARKRERSNNFPEVRQCNNTPDVFEKARMSSTVKKIEEGGSNNAPLLGTAFDWKTARSRATDLNSSMHVIVELQDNVEQCVRAAKAPEDRE